MTVCLIHIRLSVAPRDTIPDLFFKSDLGKEEDSLLKVNFSSLADFYTSSTCISPMKPSKTKAEQPEDIDLTTMSDNQKKEIGEKLKGCRKYREVHVETFNRIQIQNESENQIVHETTKVADNKTSHDNAKQDSDFGSNIQDVISKTTRELLKRSSNAVSSSKDDLEPNEVMQMGATVASKTVSRPSSSSTGEKNTRIEHDTRQSSSSVSTTSMSYFSGNPAVQITHGIIHLYKTNFMVSTEDDLRPPPTNMLCMLAVPASVDAHCILEFTSGFCDTIKRLQIIRDRTPNQYMVLMLFSSKKAAVNFYQTYNDTQYNSLQPDVCHLAFVASVEALPSMQDSSRSPTEAKGLMPIIDSTELPDCVLCLEKMDESVRGVLTILCTHSFHGSCLQKWEDLCCPVCRYLQTPEPETDNRCLVCGSREDLWICLICGHVGCGRYTQEHAKQHYMDTHHNYAMALKDNRVWDYAGDYFVHRLFQNKEDGKLVEQKGSNDGLEEREAKIEAVQLECMYLLTNQLDSQRKHWEERLAKVEAMACTDRDAADQQLADIQQKLEYLKKEKSVLEKKNQTLSSKYQSSLHELSTEKELNNSLRKNQKDWKEKVKSLEELTNSQKSEITELKDQVRDLMFYLEAQKTVDGADQATKEDIKV